MFLALLCVTILRNIDVQALETACLTDGFPSHCHMFLSNEQNRESSDKNSR